MKLFKKASAAILAGVMSLALLAGCSAGTNLPEIPDTDEPTTANAQDTVLKYVNFYRNSDQNLVEAGLVGIDAGLDAKAQAIADILAADPNTNNTDCAIWTQGGTSAFVPLKTINSKLTFAAGGSAAMTNERVYVISRNPGRTSDDVREIGRTTLSGDNVETPIVGYAFDDNARAYEMTQEAKQQLAHAGYVMTQEPVDIGVGISTVNGREFVVIVTTAAGLDVNRILENANISTIVNPLG
ncbi:MAG: hypothetical protein ACI4LE_05070 [Faecalibacterium sp.]